MNSKELFERSKKVAPGGVHSPVRAFKSVGGQPLFFDRSEGPYIYSVEGTEYIDFCQSFGPNILGHRDSDVAEVVEKVSKKAWSLGACEPYSLELAEWMVENLPHLEKVRFVCSGTEAVMTALRIARGATGRSKVVKFNGCYHGHVDNMLVKAGSGLAGEAASDSAGVSEELARTTLVVDLNDEAGLKKVFDEHGPDIAALIIEPLPANFGLLQQSQEFLKLTRELCDNSGALLIFDEVISGFRVGLEGMVGHTGIVPDLVTYGKVMGGGFPVGCYAGKSKYMDLIAPAGPVYQAGTLAANPIGMAAGLATLKKLVSQKVFQTLEARTQKFCQTIREGFEAKNIPMDIVHQASLFWLHKKTDKPIRGVADFAPDHSERFGSFFHYLLEAGVYIAPSAFEVGFISMAHSEELLAEAANKIIEAGQKAFQGT